MITRSEENRDVYLTSRYSWVGSQEISPKVPMEIVNRLYKCIGQVADFPCRWYTCMPLDRTSTFTGYICQYTAKPIPPY